MFERLLTSCQNIFKIPELRTRILFTLGMLVVYRVGAHIPTPGINGEALQDFLQKQGGALLGFLDIFSGGSLSRLTIFALGIMPYISASIILQLLTVVIPHLTKLAKEGERGRKKIIQYTRFGTIGIALIQGFGIAVGLEQMNNGAFVLTPGWSFRFMTVITLCAGTGFLMWLGEQITERGIAIGLGWTPVGGEILFIEATRMPGKGKLTLTGSLGGRTGLELHVGLRRGRVSLWRSRACRRNEQQAGNDKRAPERHGGYPSRYPPICLTSPGSTWFPAYRWRSL